MQNPIEIKYLSKEEKLQIMEAIWEDLSKDEEQVESPEWHQDALQETSDRLYAGQEEIFEWREAKTKLRKQFE